MTPDERAAALEHVNEAGLDAERIYAFLLGAPRGEAVGYLRFMLKGQAALEVAFQHLKRAVEVKTTELNPKEQSHGFH